ncbi:MgtC/SapB family protein [Hansschlegelia quercus]|uniref:Protein MgtC n=1 Tax=Hansschlegelia quercus TaxID=2528245 RepID=A0A4Q9GJA3_9HYPH|nr:MgtC/SapB family protein [Hansschlegelia quercus]TBN54379.1 MgtC/SapB family protein [Hansschlegelia quercus]
MDALDAFHAETAIRLVAATLCGVVIGFNRDLKDKSAGVRTLGLVSLGACLVSLAALSDPGLRNEPGALSRVVQGILQGVLTGVGFIGAGVILKPAPDAGRARGLTTAAAVWLTAALEIACAIGKWQLVVMGVVLALVVLSLPRRLSRKLARESDDED